MTARFLPWLVMLYYQAAIAAEPGHAAIPFKQDSADSGALHGGALGILLISALAIVAVYIVRKRLNLQLPGHGGTARLLRVLETQRLGPRAQLSVIEFEGRRYLIAQGEHGVSCLVTPPDAPPLPPEPPL